MKGLGKVQIEVLQVLATAGDDFIPMREIQSKMSRWRMSTDGTMKGLLKRGLVERSDAAPAMWLWRITAEGRKSIPPI